MQELTRQQYIENISDYEKLYLLITTDDKVFLRADIENEEILRIEMMYFELNTSLTFWEANSECRGKYAGKIFFEEYENNKIAEENILQDFLAMYDDAIFLLCDNDELKNILPNYSNHAIYTVVKM